MGEPGNDSWRQERAELESIVIEWAPSLAALVGDAVVDDAGALAPALADVRARVAAALGFALPAVRLRRAATLPAHTYRVLLRGVDVGHGVVHADRSMALEPGSAPATATSIVGCDPSFGMPVRWIEPAHVAAARAAGLTVVDATTVVCTHVGELLRRHAAALFGREEALALLDAARATAPRTLDAIVPHEVSVALFTRVARELVEERVSLVDVRSIVDALADAALVPVPPEATLPAALAAVRRRLARHIVAPLAVDDTVHVLVLDDALETALRAALVLRHGEEALQPPAAVAHAVVDALRTHVADGPVVVFAPADLRRALFVFADRFVGDVHVVTGSEMPRGIDVVVAGRLSLVEPRAPAAS